MPNLKKTLDNLPSSPGVYIYKDTAGTVLYVGKAINLARRVKQYFSTDDAVGEKTRLLVSQIHAIETIKTPSEFDALLLEASLIRKYLPKYNVIARDDKSPLYIVITLDELLPRILFRRKSDIEASKRFPESKFPRFRESSSPKQKVFGPFQSGRAAHMLMRTIRRIIPYCQQKLRNGRPCFYTYLHLCDPCPSVITKMKTGNDKRCLTRLYRKNIRHIADILSGKSNKVLRMLEADMQTLAKGDKFEEASAIKRQIQSLYDLLTRRYDASLYLTNANFAQDVQNQELMSLSAVLAPYFSDLNGLSRIECIDIANISGRKATGSLVVLENGVPSNGQYRKFKIHIKAAPNDVAMIYEVVSRRFKHHEWQFPDLLVVDGGKPQVGAAIQAMQANLAAREIPVIGLAKRLEEIVLPQLDSGNQAIKTYQDSSLIPGIKRSNSIKFIIIRLPLTSPAIHLLQRIRDEAHRFARSYHHLLRSNLLK